MNKKTVKFTMVVLILLVVALYFIGGTYARYASKYTGNATVNVAKWQIDGSKVNTLTFTVAANDFVANDKIAPATKATATTEIDLTGTEVAVDIAIEATEEFKSKLSDLGLDESQMTLKIEKAVESDIKVEEGGNGTKESPFVCKLQDGAELTGKLKLNLTLEWTDEGEAWNVDNDMNTKDTTLGTQAGSKTLELPVTVIVQQHIEN